MVPSSMLIWYRHLIGTPGNIIILYWHYSLMVYRNKLWYTILSALKFHHWKLFSGSPRIDDTWGKRFCKKASCLGNIFACALYSLPFYLTCESCQFVHKKAVGISTPCNEQRNVWFAPKWDQREGSNIYIFWFPFQCQRCILSTCVRDAPLTFAWNCRFHHHRVCV
jgi:hypothetical protein